MAHDPEQQLSQYNANACSHSVVLGGGIFITVRFISKIQTAEVKTNSEIL